MAILPLVFMTIFIAEMGDKTQLLLVAMAGKYKVRDILIGTWVATAVLNILAVVVGAALSKYLDMRIIKTAAAIAFFYFSWSTLKNYDDDEDEELKEGKGNVAAILAIFGTFFIGELGDKTQLSAITLAATYTNRSVFNASMVFLGATLALIAADFIGLVVGLFMKSKMPTKLLNIVSFLIFGIFGAVNINQAANNIFVNDTTKMGLLATIVTSAFIILCLITLLIKRKRKKA